MLVFRLHNKVQYGQHINFFLTPPLQNCRIEVRKPGEQRFKRPSQNVGQNVSM